VTRYKWDLRKARIVTKYKADWKKKISVIHRFCDLGAEDEEAGEGESVITRQPVFVVVCQM
jgi:hypothetical protein